ncbi:MAG: FUSC family protein, partial [Acetobacteraceae bacterium]
MRLLATTPEANLARLPIALDLRAISVEEGIRAGLSVAVIVAADEWVRSPLLLEAALGALLTCLCDSGGPIRRRLPGLLSFTLIGALLTIGFGLARTAGLALAVPLACLGVFACSIARVWGQSSLQVGNLLVVVLVLALDTQQTVPSALLTAGAFVAGCLWATLLTMVIWRVHPFRPARRAVADTFRAIARLVADLRRLVGTDCKPDEWEAHARGHRRSVRDTVERARDAVQDTLRVRGQASPRAFQGLMRVEAADQIFGALIALSDLLEADRDPALRAATDRLLRLLRPALIVIADAVAADDPGLGHSRPLGRLARMGAAIDAIAAIGAEPKLAAVTDYIAERLRMAVTLTAPPNDKPGALPLDTVPAGHWMDRVLTPLRANLDWQSASFRHALRAAAVTGPALLFTLTASGHYQHWLTITLILTLQPFYALTWQRALERIGGTVLGGLAAAVIALVCTTPLAIAAALFPLAILAFSIRAVSYGAFIACLTPLVVLLTEYSRPGTGELLIAGARALYTVAGGVLAVLGCLLLWPSWEPDRLKQELRAAIMAHADFAEAELDALLGTASPAAVDRARRAAGVASNNLETSISRALHEPRRSVNQELRAPMVADAAMRRMAGRLSALQLDPHDADGLSPEALRAWRAWIGSALRALAEGKTLPGRRPEGRAPDALVRIARQIELMQGALVPIG